MSTESDETITEPGVNQLLTHIRENPLAYAVGVLILQQLGLLTKAATQLQGVCF